MVYKITTSFRYLEHQVTLDNETRPEALGNELVRELLAMKLVQGLLAIDSESRILAGVPEMSEITMRNK